MKSFARWVLTIFMVLAGVNHFRDPAAYVRIVPAALPAHLALVYASGVAEILGGLGLVLPATRRAAAWGLIALLVAIFPANVYMAIHHLPLGGRVPPAWVLWARLPLQLPLIAWAWWVGREAQSPQGSPPSSPSSPSSPPHGSP
jgi:uncharacterized membrane protein